MNKFSEHSEGIDNLSKLREEFLQKINEQNQKINNITEKVNQLEKESKEIKKILSKIRYENAFMRNLFWTMEGNKTLNDINYVEDKLKFFAGNTNEGAEMIVNLLENLKTLMGSGDDEDHHLSDIGFNEELLPEEIRKKYVKLKKKANCGIKDCDCIALLLSIKEINDSSPQVTQKRYDLLKNLIEMPVKDWEQKKVEIKKLLNSYEE
jgi:uncharacterized protein Yka (UPF0111/DUF47 family)